MVPTNTLPPFAMTKNSNNKKKPSDDFVGLLAKHEPRIRRYVLSLVADYETTEDVIQETFIAIWHKFDEYDPERPFYPWACQFARNKVLNFYKKQTIRRRYFSDMTVELLMQVEERTSSTMTEQIESLNKCVKKLSSDDQTLLRHRYSEEITIAEVANLTGRPVEKLYRSLERIRRVLLQCIRANGKLMKSGA